MVHPKIFLCTHLKYQCLAGLIMNNFPSLIAIFRTVNILWKRTKFFRDHWLCYQVEIIPQIPHLSPSIVERSHWNYPTPIAKQTNITGEPRDLEGQKEKKKQMNAWHISHFPVNSKNVFLLINLLLSNWATSLFHLRSFRHTIWREGVERQYYIIRQSNECFDVAVFVVMIHNWSE